MARKGYKAVRSLPYEDWPESDRLAVSEALPLDPADAAFIFGLQGEKRQALLSPKYRASVLFGAKRFMLFVATHHPEMMSFPLVDRITPFVIGRFCVHLRETLKPSSVGHYLRWLETLAARLDPQRNWGWLMTLSYHLSPTLGPKEGSATTSRELFAAGEMLMAEGRDMLHHALCAGNALKRWQKFEIAAKFRDGLIIAMLAEHPFRIQNLISLELAASIREADTRYILTIEGEETKSGGAIGGETSKRLTALINEYCRAFRPLFPGHDRTKLLFLASRGTTFGIQVARNAIAGGTQKTLAIKINPHRFRHAAADEAVDDKITTPKDVSRKLGHASRDMTRRKYRRRKSTVAQQHYMGVIDSFVQSGDE